MTASSARFDGYKGTCVELLGEGTFKTVHDRLSAAIRKLSDAERANIAEELRNVYGEVDGRDPSSISLLVDRGELADAVIAGYCDLHYEKVLSLLTTRPLTKDEFDALARDLERKEKGLRAPEGEKKREIGLLVALAKKYLSKETCAHITGETGWVEEGPKKGRKRGGQLTWKMQLNTPFRKIFVLAGIKNAEASELIGHMWNATDNSLEKFEKEKAQRDDEDQRLSHEVEEKDREIAKVKRSKYWTDADVEVKAAAIKRLEREKNELIDKQTILSQSPKTFEEFNAKQVRSLRTTLRNLPRKKRK